MITLKTNGNLMSHVQIVQETLREENVTLQKYINSEEYNKKHNLNCLWINLLTIRNVLCVRILFLVYYKVELNN